VPSRIFGHDVGSAQRLLSQALIARPYARTSFWSRAKQVKSLCNELAMVLVGALGLALAAFGCTCHANRGETSHSTGARCPMSRMALKARPRRSPGPTRGGTITVLAPNDFDDTQPAPIYVDIEQITAR
jgi:hypothetical protein